MSSLDHSRQIIREAHLAPESRILADLQSRHGPSSQARARISGEGEALVTRIREDSKPGVMELFLADYGLSSEEGVALMCLAEALLRVPDAQTMDDLIEDKIAPSDWGAHLGQSSSSLINASTWALMLTGKVLRDGSERSVTDMLRATIKRVGEPVIRSAVKRAMKIMGHQFVLGETIESAMKRAKAQEEQGYTYSYDMLGEAALTQRDADTFFASYEEAILNIAKSAIHSDSRDNPGISIKLSALHPRYEQLQVKRVLDELVPRVAQLARLAAKANIGLNIDAEEADRLDLSLDVIEAVLRDPALAGWDGFGVVVQAYGKRAGPVIDWLYALSKELDRKIMVRLVKGAYWDTEIKHAQTLGMADYPVFTTKAATDISYICCAQKLLAFSDRIYPQFATHNAHTVAAVLDMATAGQAFEFQRLHGMGEAVHEIVKSKSKTRCRIYAPVGIHRDLLAYLVRRLLENGANSSFVNQLIDESVPAERLAADPFEQALVSHLPKPSALYEPERQNSTGWNLQTPVDIERFEAARAPYGATAWAWGPLVHGLEAKGTKGRVATLKEADLALSQAKPWADDASMRASVLRRAADLYEANAGELFAALTIEAKKTAQDAVDELREAVDFLRFYADEGEQLGARDARGVIACISPWNFPLAIFTGQIAAALAAGNAVLAKPADPTPAIAWLATRLLHQAGVPTDALQLLPGDGPQMGARLTQDARVDGVCFTGSTQVAQIINRNMAKHMSPDACLIAETGGLNAMVVDSTALPEQAVKDIVDGAFRSAGQRCSALRVLYLQEDIAAPFIEMLKGAMDQLTIGDPSKLSTDVGPIITAQAQQVIQKHIADAQTQGRVLKALDAPKDGTFVAPTLIKVDGIGDLAVEVFGPVLHVATFKADELDRVIDDINASGYGLTFGLHTRIDGRVAHVSSRVRAGNIYVNRNQIGAVVESQPFGGEGLSGTGPKAGGPNYVAKFTRDQVQIRPASVGQPVSASDIQRQINALPEISSQATETRIMKGPTGELNQWSTHPRGTVMCLGPTASDMRKQMRIAAYMGCNAIGVAPFATGENTFDGVLASSELAKIEGLNAVVFWGSDNDARAYRVSLAQQDGPLIPFTRSAEFSEICVLERHLCVDLTAVGGNTDLMDERAALNTARDRFEQTSKPVLRGDQRSIS